VKHSKDSPVPATLPEPVAEVAPDAPAYQPKIAEWLAQTGRTETWFADVAAHCPELPEGRSISSAQKQVAKALKSLGWVKDKQQRYRGQHRVVVWRAPK